MKSVVMISFLLFGGCWRPAVAAVRVALATLPLINPDSIGSYPLLLAQRYTTNLIFPSAIAEVDLGSGDVIAKKMGKTENVLLLKAGAAHFAPTNVSVYLANGRLYSFLVTYADSLAVFNYSFRSDSAGVAGVSAVVGSSGGLSLPRAQFRGLPVPKDSLAADAKAVSGRRFLKIGSEAGAVRLTVRSLYLKDQLLWVGLEGRNASRIDFKPDRMRFSIEDVRKVRRSAVQSIELEPVYDPAPERVAGGSSLRWAVGFRPLALAAGKKMVVVWSGIGDGRCIRLVIRGKRLLKARILN